MKRRSKDSCGRSALRHSLARYAPFRKLPLRHHQEPYGLKPFGCAVLPGQIRDREATKIVNDLVTGDWPDRQVKIGLQKIKQIQALAGDGEIAHRYIDGALAHHFEHQERQYRCQHGNGVYRVRAIVNYVTKASLAR